MGPRAGGAYQTTNSRQPPPPCPPPPPFVSSRTWWFANPAWCLSCTGCASASTSMPASARPGSPPPIVHMPLEAKHRHHHRHRHRSSTHIWPRSMAPSSASPVACRGSATSFSPTPLDPYQSRQELCRPRVGCRRAGGAQERARCSHGATRCSSRSRRSPRTRARSTCRASRTGCVRSRPTCPKRPSTRPWRSFRPLAGWLPFLDCDRPLPAGAGRCPHQRRPGGSPVVRVCARKNPAVGWRTGGGRRRGQCRGGPAALTAVTGSTARGATSLSALLAAGGLVRRKRSVRTSPVGPAETVGEPPSTSTRGPTRARAIGKVRSHEHALFLQLLID